MQSRRRLTLEAPHRAGYGQIIQSSATSHISQHLGDISPRILDQSMSSSTQYDESNHLPVASLLLPYLLRRPTLMAWEDIQLVFVFFAPSL